jgi:hypothetical protein
MSRFFNERKRGRSCPEAWVCLGPEFVGTKVKTTLL